ncbi:MAG: hypothetical protein ABIA12_00430 [Candidatus Aenigmatarchaeota archaeon]
MHDGLHFHVSSIDEPYMSCCTSVSDRRMLGSRGFLPSAADAHAALREAALSLWESAKKTADENYGDYRPFTIASEQFQGVRCVVHPGDYCLRRDGFEAECDIITDVPTALAKARLLYTPVVEASRDRALELSLYHVNTFLKAHAAGRK